MCLGAYIGHHDDMCPLSPRRILPKQREQTACLRRPGNAELKIPPPLQMNIVHLIRDDNSSAHYLRRKYASAENMYGLRRQTTWTTLSSRLCSRFGTVRDFVAKSQKSTKERDTATQWDVVAVSFSLSPRLYSFSIVDVSGTQQTEQTIACMAPIVLTLHDLLRYCAVMKVCRMPCV